MSRLQNIDDFFLTRVFSPLAWWIERSTGRNNFWQALYIHQALPVLIAIHDLAVWAVYPPHHFPWWDAFLWWPVWCFLCLIRIHVLRKMAERVDKKPDASPTAADSLVTMVPFWRVAWLAFLPLDVLSCVAFVVAVAWRWQWLICMPAFFWATLFWVAIYLGAVPRPPAHKRRQERVSLWAQWARQS